MSRRVRAAAFAFGALACAGLSAALAGTAAPPGGAELEELRAVVVTAAPLERGTVLGRREVGEDLAERRVPAAFAPPDALGVPAEALGRKLASGLPAGSYLTAADFGGGRGHDRPPGGAPAGTTPVEIEVTGAGALASTRTGVGAKVDVVVSGDVAPGPQTSRTYVAARDATLLALREAKEETGLAADRWIATLALSRGAALRLIRAEGAAASIRLLAG